MSTIDKIKAALGTRPGKMPSEAYRRAALTLWSGRALTLTDAEFAQLAVTLGITDAVEASERRAAERAGLPSASAHLAEHAERPERSAASERGAA